MQLTTSLPVSFYQLAKTDFSTKTKKKIIGLSSEKLQLLLSFQNTSTFSFSFSFFFFVFVGPHLWHLEVPSLGVESEPQLPAYTTATTTTHLSRVCHLHHSSQQHRIFNH